MGTITKEIKIDTKLLKSISNIAKKENRTENNVINDMIKKGLKSTENKKAVFDRVERLTNGKIKIANKDSYNPNPTEKELNSIVGIAKAPKGVNPVTALLDLRNGKD